MFAVDFLDGDVVEWHRLEGDLERRTVADYAPSIYVAGPDRALTSLEATARDWSRVVGAGRERWRTSLHADEPAAVLRLDVEPETPHRVARRVRDEYEPDRHAPGTLKLYNVDLASGFRYCLEGEPLAMPGDDASLRTLRIRLPDPGLADRDVTDLAIGGGDSEDADRTSGGAANRVGSHERVPGDEAASLRTLARRLRSVDPDVLVLSSADLVPLLAERAAAHDVDLPLGRLDRDPPYRKLAGANAFHSYGRTGHSPARYSVPGRAIVDTSNSFLWAKSGLDGLRYLAARSARPLQETAWGSIGTILTSIQTREAYERGVLVPWQKWEPERFKDVSTLHAADRGGTTIEPEPGYYEDVREVDFASLYPNVIRRRNVSPETVDCDCCTGADVPELGYTICEERGFLPDVLAPLLGDRERFKKQIAEIEASGDEAAPEDGSDESAAGLRAKSGGESAAALRAKSGAIKWILVSCFGYQGYRNAKFGRIECHEAINAYARDILLTGKERFEEGGWEIVHGIVDSLWLTADPRRSGDPAPVDDLCDVISEEVGIELEPEGRYDWLCLLPRRDGRDGRVGGRGGALMRYFGRKSGVDADPETGAGFKYRGIECRQRSTPAFVADAQRDLIGVLDRDPRPEAVCDRLEGHLERLRAGDVDPRELVVRTRLAKPPEEYARNTRTAAALRRASDLGLEYHAGQDVAYVIVEDEAEPVGNTGEVGAEPVGNTGEVGAEPVGNTGEVGAEPAVNVGRAGVRQPGRVRLAFEEIPEYDADAYADLLVRAAESVTLSFGWDRTDVRRHLRRERDATLSAF